jgi:hypothetical protein
MEKDSSNIIMTELQSSKIVYKGDTSSSLFSRYKKPESNTKNVLTNIPTTVLEEVVPLLNSRAYTLASAADHLGVSSRMLSLYLKENRFSWSIEHRAYLPTDAYEKYRTSKLEKKLSLPSKGQKKATTKKKITLNLPKYISNILEIKKCILNKSSDEIISKLVLDSASQDEIRIAKNSSLDIRYKVVDESEEDSVIEADS